MRSSPANLTLHNGQATDRSGWFVDLHGHQLYMREGHLAPTCPHQGHGPMLWRLIRETGERAAS